MNEGNVLEEELGLGIDGGKFDVVDVDVNQLGVTMTLESLISKDQIQLVKSNRLTRQLANQKDFLRIALILLFLLVTVFPAYSLISLTESRYFKQFLYTRN